jgi:hypothetical protein
MMNKSELKKELGSLDMLISALSDELVRQPEMKSQSGAANLLVREMEEALCELRQARGLKRMLLTAIESRPDAVIAEITSRRENRHTSPSSAC